MKIIKIKYIKYLILLAFIAVFQQFAFAQISSSDSLTHYLEMAARNNPGVQAAFSLYQASLQRVPQAGALPDPQFDVGFFFKPMELVEGRQIAQFQLMQMFPWFGTRQAARTEAQQMAKMAYGHFRETRDQLWLDVYTQWFTLCRLQRQLKNSHQNRHLLTHLEELALKRFSSSAGSASGLGGAMSMPSASTTSSSSAGAGMSGMAGMANMGGASGNQPQMRESASMSSQGAMSSMGGASAGMADVLRIRLEIGELDNNIESILSTIQTEKVKFNILLNRDTGSPLQIPDTLTQIPFIFDENFIIEQIRRQNPMLAMLAEEKVAIEAMAEMDRRMSYPMFGVGLQYMLINKSHHATDMGSMNGRDMLMPMVSVTIPVYRNRYRAQQRENAYLQQANSENFANTLNMLEAELYRIKNDLDNASRQILLYGKQSELVQIVYELTVQEFASGAGDLTNVLQIQRQLLDYELKTSEAIADFNTMVAHIQKLISTTQE